MEDRNETLNILKSLNTLKKVMAIDKLDGILTRLDDLETVFGLFFERNVA